MLAEAQSRTKAALDSMAAAQADGRQLQQQLHLLVSGLAPLVCLDNSLQHALTSADNTESFSLCLQQLLQQVCSHALHTQVTVCLSKVSTSCSGGSCLLHAWARMHCCMFSCLAIIEGETGPESMAK